MPTPREIAIISDVVVTTSREMKKKLGIDPRVRWSERLTSTLGNSFSHEIKLSAPIFRHMIDDKGIEYTCREMRELLAHEFSHIVHSGHGPGWARTVRMLGYTPDIYHREECGKDLYSTADQRASYPVGQWVEYTIKGQHYTGQIIRHSAKSLSVSVGESKRYWRIPWSRTEIIE